MPPRRGRVDASLSRDAAGRGDRQRACRTRTSEASTLLVLQPTRILGVARAAGAAWRHRQPLVISIDDLQWADADSVVLLEELLRPAERPAMLTLLSFRSEEIAAKPFLQALLERAGSRHVVRALARADDGRRSTRADRVALAGDSPLSERSEYCRSPVRRVAVLSVLEQLARYAGVDRIESTIMRPTFAEMFDDAPGCAASGSARASSRRWRSAAGRWRPISSATRAASRATGSRSWRCSAPPISFAAAARRSGSRPITIGSARRLPRRWPPTTVRRIHGLMVQALVERRSDDCEALFEHYRGAGDPENASIQAGLAAAKASTALAFDRAASFYRHALALTPASSAGRTHGGKDWPTRSPTPAGRPRPPTPTCARRQEQVTPSASSSSDAAAEQFLIGGHIDRGLDLIRTHARGHGGTRAPKPACGAAVVVVATRTASMARIALCCKAGRRHRRRDAPSRGHLLVGDDGPGAGGHDQRLGFQRAPPAHGARCRRTVPYRPRDGDRVGRQERRSDRQNVARETRRSSRRHSRRASEPRTRSPCRSWRTASSR